MLHEFLVNNRELITDRARQRVRQRLSTGSLTAQIEHGIPQFLGQLIAALSLRPTGKAQAPASDRKGISESAALNGAELLKDGLTIAQVVHGYGDVCQVVTELASETKSAIDPEEFQIFNRCLDDAIAGAVTAFSKERERDISYEGTERLGLLAHELRNLIGTAILSFDVIKKGTVGAAGSTGAMHSRCLSGLRVLVDRSLAEVRMETSSPLVERISLLEFVEEIEISAAMHAESHGLHLTVDAVDSDLAVDADWQLLASALSNLLQNAFKYSRAGGHVRLTTSATTDRVLIEVQDECGGLPPDKAALLFRPFTRENDDHTGLGLGLTVARRAIRANSGELYARDIPGRGCVFTIDLPRQTSAAGRRQRGNASSA